MPPRLTVVGSVNLDLVARTERLPRAGETVTGAAFARIPGGKGANQAVAAARLGAEVVLIACVGDDDFHRAAVTELAEAGVDMSRFKVADGAPTGVALVTVDAAGENSIVVAPGANEELLPADVDVPDCDGVLCQLEIPLDTVAHVAQTAPGEFFLNAAPARVPVPVADVTIVNRYELEALSHRDGVIAVTLGAEGAILMEGGEEVARAAPPTVEAVDGTGAGDAFTACLVVSLLEGRERERVAAARLHRRCARRLALRRPDVPADRRGGGCAPVTPTPIVIDCDPGHDDAIAILLALASPEVELRGITTVAGNQTLEKTTCNALKILELAGRTDVPVAAGAERPLRRELRTAPNVHGESGLDGPDLPEPSTAPVDAHAADLLAELLEPGVVLVPTGPLTNVALLLERHPGVRDRLERIVWMGGAIGEGNVTPAAEFNAFVDPEAAAAVFASGIQVTLIGLDVTHKALFTRAHAERLRGTGRSGKVVAELSDFFQRFHETRYGFDGSPIHDALAVAEVIDPSLVTTVECNVEIETASQHCDGRTVVDRWHVTGGVTNCKAGVDVDAERFLELLVDRISTLP